MIKTKAKVLWALSISAVFIPYFILSVVRQRGELPEGGGWYVQAHPSLGGHQLPFLTTVSNSGAAIKNGKRVKSDPDYALLHVVVYDPVAGRKWENFWTLAEAEADLKVLVYASELQKAGRFILPMGRRTLKVEIPRDQDMSGTSDGFTYAAVWTRKRPP